MKKILSLISTVACAIFFISCVSVNTENNSNYLISSNYYNKYKNIGVQLQVEDVPMAEWCNIYRIDDKSSINFFIHLYGYGSKMREGVISDYFVEPGKEYKYKILYSGFDSNGNYVDNIKTVYKVVTPTTGLGELKIEGKGKISYDENTSTLTFNDFPTFSNEIENFIDNTFSSKEIKFIYEDKESDTGFTEYAICNTNPHKADQADKYRWTRKTSFYIPESINKSNNLNLFDKPLTFRGGGISIINEDLSTCYFNWFNDELGEVFPEPITVHIEQ